MELGVEIAEMGWDLALRAQSRRAQAMSSVWLREEGGVVGDISKGDNSRGNSGWGGFNLEGKRAPSRLEKDSTLIGQIQTAMDHDLENEVAIREEGKKRAKGDIEESSTMGGECLKLIIYYRWLPRGKPTSRNENTKLERLRFGESTDSSETSAFAKVTLSPSGLLYGDKN
ncbi:hypothetical protein EPI10_020367 [Gossypium australe]|uniref:Uncharacterized protein n=1 Tax=Gossypium australe TaxID=47621 RepID=A0A5B6WE13_9ROSI|nr:hypothetical protein EPI10_020367 [Gossypium australe]